jgi:DNA-binding SARP family transcriptional activator
MTPVPPTLALMSGFELCDAGHCLAIPMSAQRLLAFLAMQTRPLQRVYVAGTLWLNASEERANASLRSTLWRLRRPRTRLVSVTSTHLALAPEVRVDFQIASATAHRLLAGREPPRRGDLDEMRHAGDLLPDWYDDWVAIERERFRQLRLHALENLCRRLVAQRRYGEAIEAGLAAIDAEPLRESAHRAVIGVHLAERNLAEAIHQYESYRLLARRALGVDPSNELKAMLLAAGLDSAIERRSEVRAPRAALTRAHASARSALGAGRRPVLSHDAS